MTECVAFIGPPGSSKTTQIRMLVDNIGASDVLIASVPRLVRGEPELEALVTAEERSRVSALRPAANAARIVGRLAPIELDEILFRAVARVRGVRFVAFDGCPRGLQQARLLLTVDDLARRTCVAELAFPSGTAQMSVARQISREVARRGADSAEARRPVFERKVRTFLEDTVPGLAVLRSAGIRCVRLDATLPREDIHERVIEMLVRAPRAARPGVALVAV